MSEDERCLDGFHSTECPGCGEARAEPRAEGLRATALGSGYAWFDEKTDRYVIAVDDLRAALEEPTP